MSGAGILVMSDLDRTLIPNGIQEESAQARPLFRRLAAHPGVELAYVSGRSLDLVLEAVRQYDLPLPRWAVCDVGTAIHQRTDNAWQEVRQWQTLIGVDFPPSLREEIVRRLTPCPNLVAQEAAKQSPFKLSYYWDPELAAPEEWVRRVLVDLEVSLVVSVDESSNQGLLDILPPRADKLHAVRFLVEHTRCPKERAVFAGDSGNDLVVLISEVQAVLVANATDEVRAKALEMARAAGNEDSLYLAGGGCMGMNGNYAAGVLEGICRFIPQAAEWLDRESP